MTAQVLPSRAICRLPFAAVLARTETARPHEPDAAPARRGPRGRDRPPPGSCRSVCTAYRPETPGLPAPPQREPDTPQCLFKGSSAAMAHPVLARVSTAAATAQPDRGPLSGLGRPKPAWLGDGGRAAVEPGFQPPGPCALWDVPSTAQNRAAGSGAPITASMHGALPGRRAVRRALPANPWGDGCAMAPAAGRPPWRRADTSWRTWARLTPIEPKDARTSGS